MKKIAVYPGSFDPVTNGHLDIIVRAARVFDEVVVAVLNNSSKQALFSVEERVALLEKVTEKLPNVRVDAFGGLLVNYVKHIKADVIIKGLRAISDFEYEFQMSLMNQQLDAKIETLFMMTSSKYSFLSSSMAKEVGRLGGSIDDMVPQEVLNIVRDKLQDL